MSHPSWALHEVDLAATDPDELSALIDDCIDEGKSLAFKDSRESGDIRAVAISWDAYVHLTALAFAAKDSAPDRIAAAVEEEIVRDVQGDILR